MTSWADIDEPVNETSTIVSPSKSVSKYVPPHLRRQEVEKKPAPKKETASSWEFQAPATTRSAPKPHDVDKTKDRKPFARDDARGWGKADDDRDDKKYHSKRYVLLFSSVSQPHFFLNIQSSWQKLRKGFSLEPFQATVGKLSIL